MEKKRKDWKTLVTFICLFSFLIAEISFFNSRFWRSWDWSKQTAASVSVNPSAMPSANEEKPVEAKETVKEESIAEKAVEMTHTVARGEWLIKIGKLYNVNYRAIYQANQDKIKNPDKIYPGQIFIIPQVEAKDFNMTVSEKPAKALKAKSERKVKESPISRVFKPEARFAKVMIDGQEYTQIIEPFPKPTRFWRRVNAARFGERNLNRAIDGFQIDREVKREMKQAVKSEAKWMQFTSGVFFNEMYFGNYQKWQNVETKFDNNQWYAAKVWLVPQGDRIYALVITRWCNNPAWIVLVKTSPEEPKRPEEPRIRIPEEPRVPLVPEEPKVPEEPPQLLIPPPGKEIPPPPITPPKKVEKSIFQPDFESFIWAGYYWPFKGTGYSRYAGGRVNIFLTEHETSLGRMREGFSATYNAWEGESGSQFGYRGHWYAYGGIVDLSGNTKGGNAYKFSLVAGIGEQTDKGVSGDSKYRAKQKTDLFYTGLGVDYYPSSVIQKIEAWGDVKIDTGHEKSSTWDGRRIPSENDKATDKTSFSAGTRVYFWNWPDAHLKGGLIGKADYAVEDKHVGLEIGPFVSDSYDILKASTTYRNVSNSIYKENNGSALGVGIDIDIGQALKMFWGKMKGSDKGSANNGQTVEKK